MNKDYAEIESSQKQHFNLLEHEEKMYQLQLQSDFSLVSSLKPKIFQDGNEWCVLYGDNLQEGLAGFGKTIRKALQDFNGEFEREINK